MVLPVEIAKKHYLWEENTIESFLVNMSNNNQNITFSKLVQSLESDCDEKERMVILEELKNSNPTDDALLGAKMLLEANNWDYTVLKKAFAKTEERINQIASKPQKNSVSYWKYAAVLIPIALVLGYFVNSSLTPKDSIEQYYTKEEGLPNFMGTETNNWQNLMELYRANKMKETFVVSSELLAQKPQNDTAIYFHGVIGYELKNYQVAKTDFSRIAQNKQSVFYYDATFRLGFALHNLNENKAAKQQFELVKRDADNPFNESAKEVLEY